MLEKLTATGERIANAAVARQIERLAATPVPPGVDIAPSPQGIILSGKRLRRRYVTDPQLRNFAR
jgi:hypothetical protein